VIDGFRGTVEIQVQEHATITVGPGVIGIGLERRQISHIGLFKTARLPSQYAELVPGFRLVGTSLQQGQEQRFRLILASVLGVQDGQVELWRDQFGMASAPRRPRSWPHRN
jgi:hypothetical protein